MNGVKYQMQSLKNVCRLIENKFSEQAILKLLVDLVYNHLVSTNKYGEAELIKKYCKTFVHPCKT